jgi:sterol desaturase/sphingolipid hydroxylase (fatty acid hydroxylase superfamily)
MTRLLSALWHYDFAHAEGRTLRRLALGIGLLLLGFGVFDMLFDTGSGLYGYLDGHLSAHTSPLDSIFDAASFARLSYLLIGGLALYISLFAVASFVASLRKYGRKAFVPVFMAHFLANVVAMAAGLLLFALCGAVALALGYRYEAGAGVVANGYKVALDFLIGHIPTIAVLPAPLALAAGVLFASLPGYFSHWLAHHSRLVWYLAHRCHHTAEIMHPVGVGPFMFLPEIFGSLPAIVLAAACTKLFHHEPLLAETLVLGSLGIALEKFNHTTVFYDFAYRNRLVRWLSAYFGNGVYHYAHHTSKEGDEIVNVGGAPFLLWDRVFGTYRTPTAVAPRVGLTNNTRIRLNPFAIVLSGWQQIGYELKMNRSWRTRFWILFGTVYWAPPVSRDYLILGYPPVLLDSIPTLADRDPVYAHR